MALNLKAKETLVQIGKYAGTYRYVLSPVLYNKLAEDKVIDEACVRSNLISERTAGQSKYTLGKMLTLAMDGITSLF